MLLRLFKGTGPGVIFMIIVTLGAVWISAFIKPGVSSGLINETDSMPLYGLMKLLINNHYHLSLILAFLMVSLMAFLIVNFNTTVFFIHERTFLPALFYVLYGGLFPEYQLMNPVLPASIFLMLALMRIMNCYHNTGTAYSFFDAGILISTGSLFYANLIWFGLLIIIAIMIIRTGNLKEIVISISGLITPYLILFSVYYIIGKDLIALFKLVVNNLFEHSSGYPFSRLTTATLIFSGMLLLVSLFKLIQQMNTKKIKSRKTFSLIIWTFLIAVVVYYAVPSVSVEIIWLISIPVSYLLAHYFVFAKKKLVPEILFSLLFVFIILIQIWYLK
jgi:hypothetical protein